MSGMTETDPRDTRHEELTSKIATLEATIAQLCQQVQLLTNASAQQNTTLSHKDESLHREKRLDRKDSPRKHKRPQTYSAPSHVAEDINEAAPMTDDRPTAWDDYLPMRQMISLNRCSGYTAEVHESAEDTNTNHVHNRLIERLSELVSAAERMAKSPLHNNETENNITQQSCPPTTEMTPRPLLRPSPQHITPEQKLVIAAAEWKKLLSKNKKTIAVRQSSPLTSNNRENNPWGDELIEKGENVTRVYSLNVNGLSLDKRGGRFDDLCKVAKEVQTDILCCQEHNLDTTKHHVRSILYDTARHHWNRSRLISGTTPISFETNYKPGGSMIVSMGDITGRIVVQSHDKWGRWTSQTLRGISGVNLTVIEIASESCPFPAGLPSSVVSSVLRVGSRQLSPVRSRSTI
jgi:hypothetical protein